ncbi:MAG: protein kinase [Blastocatellia bacterium]|nr:protein kinase [Blastocatellia bacterium]
MPRFRNLLPTFLLCLALLSGWVSWALPTTCARERQRFTGLSLAEGLPASTVQAIFQDRSGFLWVGTVDGLCRFDGYAFTVYRHQPNNPHSLPQNDIRVIWEDPQGFLWVGTRDSGIGCLDRATQQFQTFRHQPDNPKSIGGDQIRAFCPDNAGRLWIGTYGGGLSALDLKTREAMTYQANPTDPASLSGDEISSLAVDHAGILWVGTFEKGLCSLDPATGRFHRYGVQPDDPGGLSSRRIRCLYVDRAGVLWVGTYGGGLNYFNSVNQQFTAFRYNPQVTGGLSDDTVYSIREDNLGQLWIGTRDSGVCVFDRLTATFSKQQSDSFGFTSVIYQDQEGSLWFGSWDGLWRVDEPTNRFASFRPSDAHAPGRSNEQTFGLCFDRQGKIWAGTRNRGIFRFDPETNQWQVFQHDPKNPHSLSHDEIRTIFADHQGTIWVGTDGAGLSRFDPATAGFTNFSFDSTVRAGLTPNRVFDLAEDPEGKLWLGTLGGGLCRFDPATAQFAKVLSLGTGSQELTGTWIQAVLVDRTGGIWIGLLDGGLYRFHPATGKLERFSTRPNGPQGPILYAINDLFEDPAGKVWIGMAGNGLAAYDPQTDQFTFFGEVNGLPSDSICAIRSDASGHLWVSTKNGLARFQPANGTFRLFEAADGLQSNEFLPGSVSGSADGTKLCFGGSNGFTLFQPNRITDYTYQPPVRLTAITKNNHSLAQSTDVSQLSELTVEYTESMVTFEFAALSFVNSRKNRYAYKLEGFDQDWIQNGTKREATYTNLDGGTYIFRVKAANCDGYWNETGLSLRVRVIPPPWKRWWAYTLYALATGGVIFGLFRSQLNRVRTLGALREAELKAETAARLERQNVELDQKNRELGQKNQELIASQQRADRIFSALAEALPGTVLDDKYRLEEKIGAGGFGVVFRATHLTLNRPIAVKVFRPLPGNDSAQAAERFKLEGISASRIQHPNAIQVLDSGVSSEGIAYLVMELLEGRTLSEELHENKAFSLKRCLNIVIQVCEALTEAHRLGIIHRDIKPENVFLNRGPEGETVKVVDFGVAKMVGEDSMGEIAASLTATGSILGTPYYLAPERISNLPYDGRSDVYSVGVMLFEMLCGRLPFAIGASGLVGLVVAHVHEAPPSLRSYNPVVPQKVEAIVNRTLVKNPADRPTAKELAALLSDTLGHLSAEEGNLVLSHPTQEFMTRPTISSLPTGFTPSMDISVVPTHEIGTLDKRKD